MILIRKNTVGRTYTLSATPDNKTSTEIATDGKKITVNMDIDEVSQCWFNWQMRGQFVQQAFSKFTASEREFLISGVTPEEWNRIFNDYNNQEDDDRGFIRDRNKDRAE